MTEKLKISERISQAPRYAVDPVAFARALIGAPLLIAVLGMWVAGIPVFALILGGPIYLIVGTPILLIYLHFKPGTPGGAGQLAIFTALIGSMITVLVLAAAGDVDILPTVGLLSLFAAAFALMWGVTFGKLYNRWRSDASRQPLPPLFAH